MKFQKVDSDSCYMVWKSGLYSIHLFHYTYGGGWEKTQKDGYWAYHDGKRINGSIVYSCFDTLQEAIDACEKYEIKRS